MQVVSKGIYKYQGWTIRRTTTDELETKQWLAEKDSLITYGNTIQDIRKYIDLLNETKKEFRELHRERIEKINGDLQ